MSPNEARKLVLLCKIVGLVWPAIRVMLLITHKPLVAKIDELVRDLER